MINLDEVVRANNATKDTKRSEVKEPNPGFLVQRTVTHIRDPAMLVNKAQVQRGAALLITSFFEGCLAYEGHHVDTEIANYNINCY